ncbi:hypothetical protein [Caudoviricetes sp.]|nr:hypothetical protein [Caudoviricetes sp.]UOF81511.1 hypothetical protein [Caudoviricetes sp.]
MADTSYGILNGISKKLVDNGDGTYSEEVFALNGLKIPNHDYISLSYTGSNLTGVVYKTGGSSGTTVATLTLAYDGSSNLTSVTRS